MSGSPVVSVAHMPPLDACPGRHGRVAALFTMAFLLVAFATTASPVAARNDQGLLDSTTTDPQAPAPTYDISYPQCGRQLPNAVTSAERIVGVNGGRVFDANPCLAAEDDEHGSQLGWAGSDAVFYANTGNPGPDVSTHWPDGQTMPRECNTPANPGRDNADCAFDYGWNAAADSYRTAVAAYVSLGWAPADATRTPKANDWWLDVETGNSWRDDAALNVATLEGAVAYLESMDVADVGFYSTQRQWDRITNGSLTFADYPAWHAGASTLDEARDNCDDSSFTGGPLVLAQYLDDGFDADYHCPR
jgi:hypothetical protein